MAIQLSQSSPARDDWRLLSLASLVRSNQTCWQRGTLRKLHLDRLAIFHPPFVLPIAWHTTVAPTSHSLVPLINRSINHHHDDRAKYDIMSRKGSNVDKTYLQL